jgi:hypothetical protein
MFLAMAALTAGLIEGRSDWTGPATIGLLVGGLVALAAFVRIQRTRAAPMLDLELLRRPLFRTSIAGAGVTGLATVGLMSYAPALAARGLHRSELAAGAIVAVWSLTSMVVALQARRLPSRIESRTRLAAGLAISGVGTLALADLTPHAGWTRLIPGLVIAGVGSGLANAALGRLAVESVPAGSAGLGSGANNTARYLGSALGIAIVAAVITADGPDPADVVHGWNHAAIASGALSLVAAILTRRVRAIRPATAAPARVRRRRAWLPGHRG